ncbi:OLC1v1030310C1 [Oldenlandia corymbosa var. corymbosa]|uniref:OLC1v1030310C1 n=1 Tax=Oldenlandia corymbosa var. corymbosa TaxID=529605 RepID=A0AAV1CGJ7_OLDCO|nr:OLC1v1030310C1 [Oldenlandia corymbosa var. corymbosa]
MGMGGQENKELEQSRVAHTEKINKGITIVDQGSLEERDRDQSHEERGNIVVDKENVIGDKGKGKIEEGGESSAQEVMKGESNARTGNGEQSGVKSWTDMVRKEIHERQLRTGEGGSDHIESLFGQGMKLDGSDWKGDDTYME